MKKRITTLFIFLLATQLWGAQSPVVIGTPGAGGGDTLPIAFGKLNANDTELFSSLTSIRTVPYGGTGAASLTGMVRGNGSGAMTAIP